MAKKAIFISFDYENDKHYKFLLTALSANPRFEISFNDKSSSEIKSSEIPIVKAGLTRKINEAKYTLCIIGKFANTKHKDYLEIGSKNWINFEIAQSKKNGNKLIAIKIDNAYESPDEILNSGASWARSFTEDAITKAIDEA
jgi:hypothetical protein